MKSINLLWALLFINTIPMYSQINNTIIHESVDSIVIQRAEFEDTNCYNLISSYVYQLNTFIDSNVIETILGKGHFNYENLDTMVFSFFFEQHRKVYSLVIFINTVDLDGNKQMLKYFLDMKRVKLKITDDDGNKQMAKYYYSLQKIKRLKIKYDLYPNYRFDVENNKKCLRSSRGTFPVVRYYFIKERQALLRLPVLYFD